MRRFVGMVLFLAALCAGACLAAYLSYLAALFCGSWVARWGAPPSYGVAIANIFTLMLVGMMAGASLLTIGERKWSAMMQDRIGPNRIRVFGNPLGGIPYILADALKALTKENTEPERRSKLLFDLAPAIALAPAFMLFAIVPVGMQVSSADLRPSGWFAWAFPEVAPFPISLQVASPDAGLIYVFGIASLAVYGTALAGWSSNNKLALLGGVRASAQMVGYEVSLGLSLVGAMMAYQTLRLEEMVAGQGRLLWGWLPSLGVFLQPIGLLLFFASAFAETKRAPFDLPEGESEIVGYFVEYSGMKFAMMMLAEFIEVVVLASVVTAIFLGGGHPVVLEGWLRANLSPGWFAAVGAGSFMLKTLVLCYVQLAIRWALPRFRYDQVQTLCWKMLLPAALANVFLTGFAVLADPTLHLLAAIGLVELFALVALTLVATRAPEPRPAEPPGQGHAAAAAHH